MDLQGAKSARPKVELSENRKKRLMRRLHQIKLDKSRNYSVTYYESKLRKLKNNNINLAKSLAEQRQVSNSWFEEFVASKSILQETQEKLLRYQIIEDGNFESAVEAEMEKRLRTFTEPLDAAIKLSLDSCVLLCDNLSKVKQHVSTLIRSTENGRTVDLRNYSRNSRGIAGSRPPLCKNGAPKSPRKNVVHPMVEGHVIGPAQICLPRVSLEDRYRYRLQERAERLEDQNNMSAINEQSIALTEESNYSEALADSTEEIDRESTAERSTLFSIQDNETNPTEETTFSVAQQNDNVSIEEVARGQSAFEDSFIISSPLLENSEDTQNNSYFSLQSSENLQETSPLKTKSPRLSRIRKSNKDLKNNCNGDLEDPLEGPSWLHLKKRKGRNSKRRKNASLPSLQRSGTVRLVLESSSDEDFEEPDLKAKKKNYRHSLASRPTQLCLSPKKELPVIIRESPPLYKQEEFDIKIGRRLKKKSSRITGSSKDENYCTVPLPLDSFILNDTLSLSHDGKPISPMDVNDFEKKPELSTFAIPNLPSVKASINNTNNPWLVHEKEPKFMNNDTCFLNASMEITECLPKILINSDEICAEAKEKKCQGLPDKENGERLIPCQDSYNCNKQNKFFKSVEQENSDKIRNMLPEKTPFDASLIGLEPSFYVKPKCSVNDTVSESCNSISYEYDATTEQIELNNSSFSSDKGKENVPPAVREISSDNETTMKLKDVTIIVQDILKSPVTEKNEMLMHNCSNINSVECNLIGSPSKKISTSVSCRKREKCNTSKNLSSCAILDKKKRFKKVSDNMTEDSDTFLIQSNEKKLASRGRPKRSLNDEAEMKAKCVKPLIVKNICKKIKTSKKKLKSEKISNRKLNKNISSEDNVAVINPSTVSDSLSLIISPIKLSVNGENLEINEECELKDCIEKLPFISKKVGPISRNSLETTDSEFSSNCSISMLNQFEQNITKCSSSNGLRGFEGFSFDERRSSVLSDLPKLMAKQVSDRIKVDPEIDDVEENKVGNGGNDIIYIQPEMIDLENESENDNVEHDPLSAAQLQPSHSPDHDFENKVVKIKRSVTELKPHNDLFDERTAKLIGECVPRQRRAASKIGSFKEPSLSTKLRNENMKKKNKPVTGRPRKKT